MAEKKEDATTDGIDYVKMAAAIAAALNVLEDKRQEDAAENVAIGCTKVTELIAYDVVGKETNDAGKVKIIERGRRPYFCKTAEEEIIFKQNNPDARIETFTIQLLKSTAKERLDDPENKKQFAPKKPQEVAL